MKTPRAHFSISISDRALPMDWELRGVTGTVAIKSSIDTLKKLSSALPAQTLGGLQLFSAEGIGGLEHLAWGAYFTLLARESGRMHFQKMELEWLSRLAGTFQLEEASRRVGVKEGMQEVVLAFLAPKDKQNNQILKKAISLIGLNSSTVHFGKNISIPKNWSRSASDFAIERSALAGI